MEIGDSVDQRRTKVEQFFTDHRDALSHQGAVVAGYRRRGGLRLGPYFKLTCRIGGRQMSVYLGAEGEMVRRVRQRLDELHRERYERLRLDRLRRSLRRHALEARRHLDDQLGSVGLRRQGHEIRGWRRRTPQLTMPPADRVPSATVAVHDAERHVH